MIDILCLCRAKAPAFVLLEEGVSKVHFRKFYPIHSCCGKGKIDKFRLLTHPQMSQKSFNHAPTGGDAMPGEDAMLRVSTVCNHVTVPDSRQ
jgi:hypothetical protein